MTAGERATSDQPSGDATVALPDDPSEHLPDDVHLVAAPTSEESRAGHWALGVRRFALDPDAPPAAAYTVAGRRLTGPQQGFGQLWRRTYTAVVEHPAPATDLLSQWRERFGEFWPKGNTFYGAAVGIEAGAVAPIIVDTPGGVRLATGVLVLYSDDESFTFVTPEGHMFAGWITFSVVANPTSPSSRALRIEVLLRPSDPLYHVAWPVMRRMESAAWAATLRNLARELCGCEADVFEHSELIDHKMLWANWRNVRYNAGLRSAWWTAAAPVRAVRRGRGAAAADRRAEHGVSP